MDRCSTSEKIAKKEQKEFGTFLRGQSRDDGSGMTQGKKIMEEKSTVRLAENAAAIYMAFLKAVFFRPIQKVLFLGKQSLQLTGIFSRCTSPGEINIAFSRFTSCIKVRVAKFQKQKPFTST